MIQIQIRDASGEARIVQISGSKNLYKIGRNPHCDIVLNDPTLQEICAELVRSGDISRDDSNSFQLRMISDELWFNFCGIKTKNALWSFDLPVQIGTSQITLQKRSPLQAREIIAPPPQPSGYQPWESFENSTRDLLWSVKKVAQTHLSVYLSGETGTGKEVLAHLLHGWSERSKGPFVPINCAALPLGLAESELFGHVKGAFTGAVLNRPGAFLQAHGGTVFLDEVADLSLEIQVKLLRFLENGEMRSVGSDRVVKSDVRVICATHRPLLQLVQEGKFRKDLYFRIASIPINIPPLRDRLQDIKGLSDFFAKKLGKNISPQAKVRLCSYSWPGNVRELRHAIDRACGIAGPFKEILTAEDFDFLGNEMSDAFSNQNLGAEDGSELLQRPIMKLSELERLLLIKALKISNGHRGEAAKMMGVARSTLFEMLKRHKIQGPRQFRHQFQWSNKTDSNSSLLEVSA